MGRRGKSKNGRVHKFSVEIPYSVDLVSSLREEAIAEGRDCIELDGDVINIRSLRLDTFFEFGFKCVDCGLEGTHFIKERSKETEPYHLNLYATREDGREVLMTKDHIIPASCGGLDIIENMQPMCSKCNGKKGNKMPKDVPTELVVLGKYLHREDFPKTKFKECLI